MTIHGDVPTLGQAKAKDLLDIPRYLLTDVERQSMDAGRCYGLGALTSRTAGRLEPTPATAWAAFKTIHPTVRGPITHEFEAAFKAARAELEAGR